MHGNSDSLFVNLIVVTIGLGLFYLVIRLVNLPNAKKEKEAARLLAESEKFFQVAEYRRALELIEKAIQSDPHIPPIAFLRRGTTYYMLEEHQNALSSYQLFLRKSSVGASSPEVELARKRIVELGGSVEW